MLIGEKTIIEEINPNSLEKIRGWRNDPNMRRYFRYYKDISFDQQLAWYKDRGNNSNPNHIYFQIMSKNNIDDRELIGCCNLSGIDYRMRSAEFGVFISPEEHGKGNGYDALKLLFSFGFDELNLHKIWCEVFDNNGSIALYRKLGFKEDGVLRDHYFHDGKYGNSIIMSVLEDEWRSLFNK